MKEIRFNNLWNICKAKSGTLSGFRGSNKKGGSPTKNPKLHKWGGGMGGLLFGTEKYVSKYYWKQNDVAETSNFVWFTVLMCSDPILKLLKRITNNSSFIFMQKFKPFFFYLSWIWVPKLGVPKIGIPNHL